MRLGQRAFFVRACRADQLQAHGLGPLAGDQAHAAGRRVEQHKVAGLQPALRLGAAQQVLHRQALEHHGGTGLEGDSVGQLADAFGRHHTQLAVAAGRLAGVGGAVAHLQVRDALAHGLDHTRGLHAELQRHGQLVHAAALVDVDVVQAHRLVADADLAGAGFADSDIHQLELFDAAVLVNADGFGGEGGHGEFLDADGRSGAACILPRKPQSCWPCKPPSRCDAGRSGFVQQRGRQMVKVPA